MKALVVLAAALLAGCSVGPLLEGDWRIVCTAESKETFASPYYTDPEIWMSYDFVVVAVGGNVVMRKTLVDGEGCLAEKRPIESF